jgi:hypothetical protein
MVRKAQSQPVTAQMYRHFAILTVAITAALALFVDGESREAVASEIVKQRPAQPGGQVGMLVRKQTRPSQGFGPDETFDSSFGAPMDGGDAFSDSGIIPPDFAESVVGLPDGFTPYGVSAAEWAKLTPEQRKALIARLEAERTAAQSPERSAQIESLAAASRARAGQSASDE